MKKYRLLDNDTTIVSGKKLFRIQACISFGNVKKGDLGGYVESERNLDQSGNAWIFGNASASGDAMAFDNARISGDAWFSGKAWIFGDARLFDKTDYMCIEGIDFYSRTTTIYRTSKDIAVSNCWFNGSLDEFEKSVRETYGENKLAKECQLLIDLVKVHFDVMDGERKEDNEGINERKY